MTGSSRGRRRGGRLGNLVAIGAGAALLAACAGSSASYQEAALKASEDGDQKTAVSLARKEVERFSGPDQCSRSANVNCGTLALAYGALAGYQIMGGDRTGGEGSFIQAKGALSLTDPAIRASATGIVYRDVSEAFWKAGDRARATAVFKEGRAAGGDEYLYMSSAAHEAEPKPADPAADMKAADAQPTDAKAVDGKVTDPKAGDPKAPGSRPAAAKLVNPRQSDRPPTN
ncbi:hypothetical protein [Reyranella sp.]|uniref:hypothetical protein n=1 Tax=Reyranella sp. TaxID=1929291 RepID=UPI003BABBC61